MAFLTQCFPGAIALLSLLLLVSETSAQAAPRLEPGTRLRVTIAPSDQYVGRFASLSGADLMLTANGSTRSVPLATIQQLEASRGRSPSIVGGAIGAIVFAGVGGAIACAANRDSYGVYCGGQNDTKVAVGAVLGGLVGGTVGALVFRRDRWVVVDPGSLR
jgi:hypothetical protein